MTVLEPHDVLLIVGKRGTGKSTRAKALAEQLLRAGYPVVAFDPHDEYSRQGNATGQVKLGPLRERVTVDELEASPKLLDAEELSLSVVPDGSPSPKELAEDFATVANLVMATGELVFLVDEIGWFSVHGQEDLDRVATQSRHASVPIIYVAQRLVQIPKTGRTQASRVFTFRQDDPADVRALEELCGEDFARDVPRLRRGKSKDWRDDLGDSSPEKRKAAS